MSKNGPNIGVKRESKSIQNRLRKVIEIFIDFWSLLGRPNVDFLMAGSEVRRQRRGPPNGINRRLYRRRSIYRSIYKYIYSMTIIFSTKKSSFNISSYSKLFIVNFNYFKGISCRCCVGEVNFNWQLENLDGDKDNLTWANLLVNSNPSSRSIFI